MGSVFPTVKKEIKKENSIFYDKMYDHATIDGSETVLAACSLLFSLMMPLLLMQDQYATTE